MASAATASASAAAAAVPAEAKQEEEKVPTLEEKLYEACNLTPWAWEPVKALLDQNPDLTVIDKNYLNFSIFHHACADNHLELLKEILPKKDWTQESKTLDSVDFTGSTPLHYAAKNENQEYADHLIRLGADGTIQNKFGRTPVHDAAYSGRLPTLKQLIAKIPADRIHAVLALKGIDARPWLGRTALHEACDQGHADIVDELLKAGADITVKDAEGNTALHVAASRGRFVCALKLIKAGSSINAKNAAEFSPFQVACKRSNWVVAQLLLEEGCDPLDNPADTVDEEKRLNVAQALVANLYLPLHVIPDLATSCAAYLHADIGNILKECTRTRHPAAVPSPAPAEAEAAAKKQKTDSQ